MTYEDVTPNSPKFIIDIARGLWGNAVSRNLAI